MTTKKTKLTIICLNSRKVKRVGAKGLKE